MHFKASLLPYFHSHSLTLSPARMDPGGARHEQTRVRVAREHAAGVVAPLVGLDDDIETRQASWNFGGALKTVGYS